MSNTDVDTVCVDNMNTVHQDTNTCVICLEDLDNNTINYNCNHILHLKCCVEYVNSQLKARQDITCPICRNIECSTGSEHYETVKKMFGYTDEETTTYPIVGVDDARNRVREEYIVIIRENQERFQNNTQGDVGNCKYAYLKLVFGMLFVVSLFIILAVVVVKKR